MPRPRMWRTSPSRLVCRAFLTCCDHQLGTWTIDAAKQWPDATFVSLPSHPPAVIMSHDAMQVGFDLVDVQIKLDYLEPSMAERIQWVHGNLCVPWAYLLKVAPHDVPA